MAHRDILRRRAIFVAFGVDADVNSYAEFDDSVENDPMRKLWTHATRHTATRAGKYGLAASSITLAPGKHLGASTLSRR